MRGTGSLLALAMLAALDAGAAPPGPVTVTATVAPEEITVGQTFTVQLEVSAPPGTTLAFPERVSDDTIELAKTEGPAPGPFSARYQGRCFALRDVAVPPLVVRYRLGDGSEGQASSAAVPLRIVSLLPRGEEPPILADIRPPVPVPVSALFVAAATAAAIALVALVLAMIRRRRRHREAPETAEPPLPPDVEALEALSRLAASALAERAEYKAFYVALTEITKRYLERRLAAPVLEMTTTETLAFLRQHPHGAPLAGIVREVAGAADHVKFARGSAQRAVAERHLQAVRELVTTLEGLLATPPAGEGEPLRRTA